MGDEAGHRSGAAAPVGVLTLALLVLPGLLPRFPEVFGMRRPGVRMTIAFGVVLRLSLSALLTALAFWRQIARFPPVFATLAPLVTVFLLSAVRVMTPDPGSGGRVRGLEDAGRGALRGDGLLFAVPVASGAIRGSPPRGVTFRTAGGSGPTGAKLSAFRACLLRSLWPCGQPAAAAGFSTPRPGEYLRKEQTRGR
jgi:hypothetical protein